MKLRLELDQEKAQEEDKIGGQIDVEKEDMKGWKEENDFRRQTCLC